MYTSSSTTLPGPGLEEEEEERRRRRR